MKPHVKQALDDHHITCTQALDQWYDWVLDHESALYERELIDNRRDGEILEKKFKAAKDRERKVSENLRRVNP